MQESKNKANSAEPPPKKGEKEINVKQKWKKKGKTIHNPTNKPDEKPQGLKVNKQTNQQWQGKNNNRSADEKKNFNNNQSIEKSGIDRKTYSNNYQNRQNFNFNRQGQHKNFSTGQKSTVYFNFKRLDDLCKKNSNDVLSMLAEKKIEFEKFLSNVPPELVVVTIRVLTNICQANFTEIVTSILSHACSANFLGRLEEYMLKLPYEKEIDKKRNKLYYDDVNRFWFDVTRFFKKVIELLPSKVCDELKSILDKINMIFETIEIFQKDYKIDDKIKDISSNLFKELQAEIKKIEEKSMAPVVVSNKPEIEDDPPEDFKSLTVIPTIEDLFNNKPFIRQCKITDPYNSVDHYLDVQFRLLREDFISPLRSGINEYLDPKSQKYRNSDLRIYRKVTLVAPEFNNNTVGITVSFQRMNNINWRHSKRLMFGGLLLLSRDNFNSILFVTVANRNEKELLRGCILVEPCEGTTITRNMYESTFVMLESKIYFEPYWAVLNAMKHMNNENFPMENYLINADTSIKLPRYLEHEPKLHYKGFQLPIGREELWPDAKELELDETQCNAFRSALTQEFSLIQGPPGTGKTFIALEIVRTLLENDQYWKHHGPIVVICLTNHALDQFLEGILKHTESIVRLGSRSKSEALKEYTLSERKQATKAHKGSHASHVMYNTKRDLESIIGSIVKTHLHVKFLNIPNVIVPLGCLKNYCNEDPVMMEMRSNEDLINWLIEIDINQYQETSNPVHMVDISEVLPKDDDQQDNVLEDDQQMGNIPDFEENWNRYMNDELELNCTMQVHNSFRPMFPLQKIDELIVSVRQQVFEHSDTLAKEGFAPQFDPTVEFKKYLQLLQVEKLSLQRELTKHPVLNQQRTPSNNPYWERYWNWVRISYDKAMYELTRLERTYRTLRLQLNDAKQLVDLATLREHRVIGLTTNGAAKLHASLRALHAPIVLVEEAAEILESHVVCSLTKDCQQVILIGDHKQLRPKASVYQLGTKFNLNISLFERMVRIRGDCTQLAHQHRMRPEIAKLITPSIYETLYNHKSVLDYPDVRGLEKNLFFLNHSHRETSHNNEESWVNQHEVVFLVALARHLILQGYDPTEITILCTYTGQLFALMKEIARYSILKQMRVTTIDNYQGEENKIILLSLVRNNGEGNIGFLKEENRVCVALSRAREGLYILGNMEDLVVKNSIWPKIKSVLEEGNAIGDVIELRCQIHSDQLIQVKDVSDFQRCPEGGCSKKCNVDMPCGHPCLSICHIRDREHKGFECRKPCTKSCPNEHPCSLKCWQGCQPCAVMVERQLKCGHTVQMPCSSDPDSFPCYIQVEATLPDCKHEIKKNCHSAIETCKCTHPCDSRLPCGHTCTLTCHVNGDPEHIEYKCMKVCAKTYAGCENKHQCRKRCHEVCGLCPIIVTGKMRSCGHYYKQIQCAVKIEEQPCLRPCKRKIPSCGHNCRLKCSDDCGKCQVKVKKISVDCGHEVEVKCCEEARSSKCSGKCKKTLPCGHPCKNKCKVTCTTACDAMVNLSQSGLCGHIFQVPCYLQKTDPKSPGLLRYCEEPCTAKLACEHSCTGNCGSCKQGCVHVSCSEPCGVSLPCGHKCDEPCRTECKPCKKDCEMQCCHSKCKQKCGMPCTPCIEPCALGCEHKKCSKRCSELCDIEPCNEPCKEMLKCDHPCVGFCGDPCPPLCRICDKQELTTILLGTEEDLNARFVYLNDCSHCIESNGLSEWLKQDNEKVKKAGEPIQVKKCPKCTTPIRKCVRLMNQIKMALDDVLLVKTKVFCGKYTDLNHMQSQHLENIKLMQRDPNVAAHPQIWSFLQGLRDRTTFVRNRKRQLLSAQEIDACRVVLELMRYMLDILSSIKKKEIAVKNTSLLRFGSRIGLRSKATSSIKTEAVESYKFIKLQVPIILTSVPPTWEITRQRLEDIQLELLRLSYMAEVCNVDAQNSSSGAPLVPQRDFDETMTKLLSAGRFDRKLEAEAQARIAELSDTKRIIAIERRVIREAMGFKQGHWYKCPNGHIYCIGDCGGAMQESRCNECGAKIGGTQHRLLSSNAVATEMDGATRAAWPQ